MTKEYLENILTEYGVAFTDSLADRLLREFKPKTGHWKHNKCDVCGASRPPLFDNYCPNCGAKMVEPQERSEV